MRALKLALLGTVWVPAALVVACSGEDDPTKDLPPADELSFVDLGPATLSDTGGYIGDIAVEVPEGAVSAVAWCGGWGDQAVGGVWKITDPSGTVRYDGDSPNPDVYRAEFLDDMAPALIPVSKGLDVEPGTWNIQWFVGAGSNGSATCEAVFRVDDVGNDANISVDLVFVGLDGIDATTAPDDPDFQAVLEQFEAEWASAGLTPSYRYVDFAGDVAKYNVVDVSDNDYSEFNDLLRTSNPPGPRAMTFFLVDEISNASAGGATILGLSAGPPGAAAFHGNSKSGVIVSTLDLDSAPGDVAKIMAHEGGHFLGLFHTTEKDGQLNDPLGDTPQCPPSADTNADGVMNSTECAGQGAENVMWWTLTSGTATFSGDQGWVVRRSPIAD